MTHRKPRQGYRPKLALLALVIPLGAVGCAFHASGGAKSSSNASANSSSSAKSESKSSAKSGANMSGSASLKGDAKASGGGDASGGGKASGSGNAGGSGKASGSGNASAKSSSKASASASGSSSSSINFKSGTRVEGLGQSKKDYKFKSTVLVGGGSSSIKLGGSTSGSTKVKTGGSISGSASGSGSAKGGGSASAGGSAKGSAGNKGSADKGGDKDKNTPSKDPVTKKDPATKKDPITKKTPAPKKDPTKKPQKPVPVTPPTPIDPPEAPPENVFGYEDPVKGCFEGVVYPLAPKTSKLPTAWDSLEAISVVYACEWDIPTRKWETGFPGVEDRFEWFAIQYSGAFHVQKAGKWKFRISSDDGSKLYIDGKLVVNNDGEHPPQSKDGTIELAAGDHDMVLEYFQGPRYHINLQVYATPPGGKEGLFSVR